MDNQYQTPTQFVNYMYPHLPPEIQSWLVAELSKSKVGQKLNLRRLNTELDKANTIMQLYKADGNTIKSLKSFDPLTKELTFHEWQTLLWGKTSKKVILDFGSPAHKKLAESNIKLTINEYVELIDYAEEKGKVNQSISPQNRLMTIQHKTNKDKYRSYIVPAKYFPELVAEETFGNDTRQ